MLSWEQIVHRKEQGDQLISKTENEAAFLIFWGLLEALMRKQAEQVSLPLERFPTSSLINHLYSQGELSIEQFDNTQIILKIRNRFAHGYQTSNLNEALLTLQNLVDELLNVWAPVTS